MGREEKLDRNDISRYRVIPSYHKARSFPFFSPQSNYYDSTVESIPHLSEMASYTSQFSPVGIEHWMRASYGIKY